MVSISKKANALKFYLMFFYIKKKFNICRAFLQLGAGLSVGLSGLAAGFAVGIVGDAGVRGTAQQPRLVDEVLLFFSSLLFCKYKDKKKCVLIKYLFNFVSYLDYTLE